MAGSQQKKGAKGARPENTKAFSSGDRSGQGRPRRDDHVFPQGGGRSEFGTHGGPNGQGGQREAPSEKDRE